LLVSTITNFVTDKRIYLDYFCKRSIAKVRCSLEVVGSGNP
jgi:hypothetical protein